jgi:hypothetical protein
MHLRIRKALALCAAAVAGGLVYALLLIPAGVRIPCLFRAVTGLRCPGCGVTDICLGLLRGGGWSLASLNVGLFLILPVLALLLGRRAWLYLRLGAVPRGRGEDRAWTALAAFLIAWGVVRNLLGI